MSWPAMTTTGRAMILEQKAVDGLKARLRGDLVKPGDEGYDVARKIWNAMIDKRPALIGRCVTPADVIQCVKFAREHDLLVSVRGGGHNVAGHALCDGGLMIDLSGMKAIRVDAVRRIAQAQPGLRWGEFDRETGAFGLATTGGIFTPTGIAGLTLGGGLGWLMGKHGLTCDNLLSAEVVTAGGELLIASADENPDLFWGLRGGGGNFGIVTSFEYRLHPVGTVVAGFLNHPIARARDALHFHRQYKERAPDELRVDAAFVTAPDGTLVMSLVPCYVGSADDAERHLQPLRAFGPPVAPMRYCTLQAMLDPVAPPDRLNYWKSSFVGELGDAAIDTLTRYAEARPSSTSFLFLEDMHGAATRVRPEDTAFAHREAHYVLLIVTSWTDAAESERHVRWVRECWDAMQPFTAGTVYVNYLGEEGEDRVRAAYGPNYDRLVALKTQYDPTNFFRLNQNITPKE